MMEVKCLDSVVYKNFKGVVTIKTFTQCLTQLVMNSLDADSTAISAQVSVQKGLMQVKDNGSGITAESLGLLGERFATSRCRSVDDLQGRPRSYGHRGEGLHAIGVVADSVMVVTQPRDGGTDDVVTLRRRVSERNSPVLPENPARKGPGTTIAAFALHKRLLVGRKHTNVEVEFEHMQRAMQEFMLMHPKVWFCFYNADIDKQLMNHGRPGSVQNALMYVHPDLEVDMFCPLKFHKKKYSIEALLYKKSYEHDKAQYLYVNKRPVLCSEVEKFVVAQYQKRVFTAHNGEERTRGSSTKKHPVYVINMNLPQTDYELIFSENNKCQVLFLYLDLILKYLERVFNILVGHKPLPVRKQHKKPAEYIDPIGFPLLNGVVSASAYKRNSKSSPPKDLEPKKDSYAIEDHSRSEFVIPSTPVDDYKPGPSKLPTEQRLNKRDCKPGPSKLATEQRHNKRKIVKRPLPISINTKLPLHKSHKNINSHEEYSKRAKKVKKSEEIPFTCTNEIIEPNKRAQIVSQRHADQVAHLVEDVDFECAPLEHEFIKGKQQIMKKFLKSTRLYNRQSRNPEVSPKEEENNFKTDDITSNLKPIAMSLPSLEITDKVNSNDGSIYTQFLTETNFEVKSKSKTDLCREVETRAKEKQDTPIQEENKNVMFKLTGNVSQEFKLARSFSNSSFGKKNIELGRKNVTSKCVQTSVILEHATRDQVTMLETGRDINYNGALFFQEPPLPMRKHPQGKFNIPNNAFQNIDQAPCPSPRIQNSNYQVEPNLFFAHEANCVVPKRKSMKKYPSNYDCNFSNLNDIPLFPCKSETQPYYFSYKDKTIKLFDCHESKSRNYQQTWQFCDDYSRPFQLMNNNSNKLLQEQLFSTNIDKQQFPERELVLEKQNCVQLQAKGHHMHSNGYETCLEDTDLSPIRKVVVHSQNQRCLPKETVNLVNNLPLLKKRLTCDSQTNTNIAKETYFQKVIPSSNKHITSANRLRVDKHDKETFSRHCIHNKSKYFSPEYEQLKSNFADVRDTFDLDNNFTEIYPSDDGTKCKDITAEAGKLEMFTETRRLQFMENMLPDDPILNDSLKNESCTFLQNMSPTSFNFSPKLKSTQLSFSVKQNENLSEEKFTLNMETSTKKILTSKMAQCFSLEVHNPRETVGEQTVVSNINDTQNISQAHMITLMEKNKENHEAKSTAYIPLEGNIMPPTLLAENTFNIRAEDFLEDSSPKEERVEWKPSCTSEWTKKQDQFDRTFYYNKRTGMTTFYSPKRENKFSLAPRPEFVPKGLSPLLVKQKKGVDKTLSPQVKENLQRVIVESYENELLTVKWLNCGYQNDPKAFFEELYKEKARLHQPPVPIANKSSLASIRFNKSILRNLVVIGQVDFKFIAALSKVTGHILIFDQHAVHERICLERLQKEYNKASWILRHPVTIFLQNSDLIFVQNQLPYLTNLGLTIDFMSNGITVRGIPLCFWRRIFKEKESNMKHIAEVTQITIDQILEIFKSEESLVCSPPIIEDVIKMEACRGAIKFGQPLSRDTCQQLIEDLQGCALPFQCAHGRPTVQPLLQLNNSTNSQTKRSNK